MLENDFIGFAINWISLVVSDSSCNSFGLPQDRWVASIKVRGYDDLVLFLS